jgi:membrane-associated PAP2 superfamily phosphatase
MGRETWTETRLALFGLAVAVAASFILLVELESQLTFAADDWLFLVRHDWSADYFLHPFHGSLVIVVGLLVYRERGRIGDRSDGAARLCTTG